MLGFHPRFDIRHNWDGRMVFISVRGWVGSVENFQGSILESNEEPHVLWRNVSINCVTARSQSLRFKVLIQLWHCVVGRVISRRFVESSGTTCPNIAPHPRNLNPHVHYCYLQGRR
jgi:hypothetical protein